MALPETFQRLGVLRLAAGENPGPADVGPQFDHGAEIDDKVSACGLALREGEDDEHDDQDREGQQADLDPALRIFSGERARETIRDNAVGGAAVLVVQEPDGQEDVLESLRAVVGCDFEIAMGIAGNLLRAELTQLRVGSLSMNICSK